jgi:hypothetical protein
MANNKIMEMEIGVNFNISTNPDLYNDSTQAFIDYIFSAHFYPNTWRIR